MLNEVKHLALEQDLRQAAGVRFFAALRMTSYICSYQNHTYAKVSQVEYNDVISGGQKCKAD